MAAGRRHPAPRINTNANPPRTSRSVARASYSRRGPRWLDFAPCLFAPAEANSPGTFQNRPIRVPICHQDRALRAPLSPPSRSCAPLMHSELDEGTRFPRPDWNPILELSLSVGLAGHTAHHSALLLVVETCQAAWCCSATVAWPSGRLADADEPTY